jgi:hypothetical protein
MGKEVARIRKQMPHDFRLECPPGKAYEPVDANAAKIPIFADTAAGAPRPPTKSVAHAALLNPGDQAFQLHRQWGRSRQVRLQEPKSVGQARLEAPAMEYSQVNPPNRFRRVRGYLRTV